jgi:ferritin-like metal-binding protein YciE
VITCTLHFSAQGCCNWHSQRNFFSVVVSSLIVEEVGTCRAKGEVVNTILSLEKKFEWPEPNAKSLWTMIVPVADKENYRTTKLKIRFIPKMKSLHDLLIEELRDLYSAETQLVSAIPQMIKAAESAQLAEGLKRHLEQTKAHVERLEKILDDLNHSPRGKKCKAMEGLIAEWKEMVKQDAEPTVRDAALIAVTQRIEHYEIAGYGSARTFAEQLGYDETAEILSMTLEEEVETDQILGEMADVVIQTGATEEI